MTISQQVSKRIDELKLAQGLDLSTAGDRIIYVSRILLRIFHTDGIIHEGFPAPEVKESLKPLTFSVSSVSNTDFHELLARYYEDLLAISVDEAEEWLRSILEEFTQSVPA